MNDNLQPITIKISYDETLEQITKTRFEKAVVSANLPFIHMLSFIFSSYPGIPEKYPPGTIGLLLNGAPPKDFDLMQDGDELTLLIPKRNNVYS